MCRSRTRSKNPLTSMASNTATSKGISSPELRSQYESLSKSQRVLPSTDTCMDRPAVPKIVTSISSARWLRIRSTK
ncbi:hypothetical protein MPTK1_8g04880 [Marchantia polymorpha subsp. ruderalis]|uniref:Uncharacterized protein n=1 Tax=Marchantia polymorpha TaxID=3197 RepID=A0A2R6VZX7_MARPO|nr:hypothetical protein MARPO_0217s0013 [Marchantia polymorpha]BBN18718.1 hypothetical protein Mp_8g04880 [Marchantia polymorpha subsp. ruderalis]|eukprot:PTQ27154.1 hypothetical protein MARPO_0217s0013 [Marchantia polymorpha]